LFVELVEFHVELPNIALHNCQSMTHATPYRVQAVIPVTGLEIYYLDSPNSCNCTLGVRAHTDARRMRRKFNVGRVIVLYKPLIQTRGG